MAFKQCLSSLTFALATALALPALADVAYVRVCGYPGDNGVFQPALYVTVNGHTSVYPVDMNGLTRTIAYDQGAATAYLRALLGDPNLFVDYSEHCAEPQAKAPAPPPEPDYPDETPNEDVRSPEV